MKLVIVDRIDQYDDIVADADFVSLIEGAHHNRRLIELVASIARDFRSLKEVKQGMAGRGPSLAKFASTYGKTRAERAAVRRIVASVTALYSRYGPQHVRGMLIEGLAKRRLGVRYGRYGSQLEDNARFRLEDGVVYDSGSNSIDVIGFDGSVGECHDCKVQARNVSRSWIEELIRCVRPNGFRIGLVTAQSKRVALNELQRKGLGVRHLAVVTHEEWWERLPLQT